MGYQLLKLYNYRNNFKNDKTVLGNISIDEF